MSALDRRDFLKMIGASAAATAVPQALWAGDDDSGRRRRPNIVFLIADDERWDMMSCAGNRYLKTPNRDRLAAEGMRFENAFVTSAVCSPSRGSFLTGKHVHQCGTQPIIHMNHTFHRNERPFPARLHDVGYHTAHFGKWHLGEGHKRKPGYDHWVGYYALTTFFDPLLTINGKQQRFKGFSDFVIADLASEHIRKVAQEEQPFCVYVAFGAPHHDFSFPEHLKGALDGVDLEMPPSVAEDVTQSGKPKCIQNSPLRGDRLGNFKQWGSFDEFVRRYMRSSLSLDESVGRIMDAVEDAGVGDDTIFVYTSDHGHMLGEHGLGAKHLAYEESIRIPMIVRYPRMIEAGSVRDDLVANIDVAPTLLDLGGAPLPDDVSGHSMKPLFEAGKKPVSGWVDDFAFLHETCVAVRTHRYKLIHYRNVGERELYDLERDPLEMTNLIDDPALRSVLKEMELRLERHLRETDFPVTLNHAISMPWLLGPFAAGNEQAILRAALAAPAGKNPVRVNGKDYAWRKPADPYPDMLAEFREARWIWMPQKAPAESEYNHKPGSHTGGFTIPMAAKKRPPLDRPPGRVYFRRTFSIPGGAGIKAACLQSAVDNHSEIHVNGKKIARGSGWVVVGTYDIAGYLTPGENVIAFVGENAGEGPNPAGLIAGLRVELADGGFVSVSSGGGWPVTDRQQTGWDAAGCDDSAWEESVDLGPRTMTPWFTGLAKAINTAAELGGRPEDLFLAAFDIEVLSDRDPFVRVHFNPHQKAVTGWVNGEELYHRREPDNPFNLTFNPPLVPGRNTLLFKGRVGDYPTLGIRVHGHEGKTRIPE
jgi:arylsulfatase A-like enzyme